MQLLRLRDLSDILDDGLPYRVLMNGTPRTKGKLGLDQMGLLRIADRHDTASICGNVVTVGDFGLKWPYEP